VVSTDRRYKEHNRRGLNLKSLLGRLFPESVRTKQDSFGSWGEQAAVRFLLDQGYRIIERNFMAKPGEIDIVAAEGNVMVFVEVKTRSSTEFGEPEEAITSQKVTHLRRVAYIYLKTNNLRIEDTAIRFDVVSIVADRETRSIKSIQLFKAIT